MGGGSRVQVQVAMQRADARLQWAWRPNRCYDARGCSAIYSRVTPSRREVTAEMMPAADARYHISSKAATSVVGSHAEGYSAEHHQTAEEADVEGTAIPRMQCRAKKKMQKRFHGTAAIQRAGAKSKARKGKRKSTRSGPLSTFAFSRRGRNARMPSTRTKSTLFCDALSVAHSDQTLA